MPLQGLDLICLISQLAASAGKCVRVSSWEVGFARLRLTQTLGKQIARESA